MSNVIVENYIKAPIVYWENSHELIDFDKPYSCTSQICNQSFYDAPFFHYWAKRLMPALVDHLRDTQQFSELEYSQSALYHRKLWELVYICQALYERGMLKEGKRGVVFGVGEECLPDLFASLGCEILATDLNADADEAQSWIQSGQNAAGNLDKLNKYRFCEPDDFRKKVTYRDVNMNEIPDDITDYDFCWSTCAFEHLGSLNHGIEFVKNSLKTLKPGGIAIHTTEYNIYSNQATFESKGISLYRRKDIEYLVSELQRGGRRYLPLIGILVMIILTDLLTYHLILKRVCICGC